MGKRKPRCFGRYWEVVPNLRNVRNRGCDECPYYTLDEESCVAASPFPSRKRIQEIKTRKREVTRKHEIFSD